MQEINKLGYNIDNLNRKITSRYFIYERKNDRNDNRPSFKLYMYTYFKRFMDRYHVTHGRMVQGCKQKENTGFVKTPSLLGAF